MEKTQNLNNLISSLIGIIGDFSADYIRGNEKLKHKALLKYSDLINDEVKKGAKLNSYCNLLLSSAYYLLDDFNKAKEILKNHNDTYLSEDSGVFSFLIYHCILSESDFILDVFLDRNYERRIKDSLQKTIARGTPREVLLGSIGLSLLLKKIRSVGTIPYNNDEWIRELKLIKSRDKK